LTPTAPAAIVVDRARTTVHRRPHRLCVDHSERDARLLEVIRQEGTFDLQMVQLRAGDYLIDDEVLVERKTVANFATSLVDGRLFPQVSRLAHSPYRAVVLIEGPTGISMPDIHPHAIEGAIISLAAMWATSGASCARAGRLRACP
jgi:DNA excision repair protein ERCC-4